MEHKAAFDIIRKEFCSLFNFKSHGDTLEVISPLVTITDKFVSVFITQRGEKIIVADGGWLSENIYDTEMSSDDLDLLELLANQYQNHFLIEHTTAPSRGKIYYKATTKMDMVPALVFDLANFIVSIVNSNAIDYKIKHDKDERDKFRGETNDFLKSIYQDRFKSNHEIGKGVRYNGVITIKNKLHLLEYVTGHTPRYFEQDLRRAIVNFQLIDDFFESSIVSNKIAIFNDKSKGFEQGFSTIYVDFLNKHTSHQPLIRSNLGEIETIIPR